MKERYVIIFSAAIVLAATVFGIFFYKARARVQTIAVVGSATRTFDSDIVKWQLSMVRNVTTQNLSQGYIQMRNDMNSVVNRLQAKGIPRKGINVQPLHTNPNYKRDGISGYRIQQTLFVVSDSLGLVEELALNPETFVSQGVIIEFSNLQFFYSKVDELKISLLGEAAKDARRRAREIAKGSGIGVGKILDAQSGVFQITEPFSNDVAPGGIYNTSSRTKDIRVTARVRFSLE